MADEYYEISPKVNDIDFFIGESKAEIAIPISSQVDIIGTKVVNALVDISISTNVPVSATKITNTSALSSSVLSVTVLALETLTALVVINISSTVTVVVKEIGRAASVSNITSSVTVVCKKITTGIAGVNISSSQATNVVKIAKVSANSAITVVPNFTVKFVSFIREALSITSRLNINAPIRFSPSYIDDTSIRTFLILDDKPLTNHNRQFDISLSPLHIENTNWNNRKSRYYKRATSSGRKTFNISWTQLPNAMVDTVDSRHGRDFLNSAAQDPDTHELKIVNQDESGLTAYTETTYTVFIRSYSETLVRRYISQGVYLYDCNLSLEEV